MGILSFLRGDKKEDALISPEAAARLVQTGLLQQFSKKDIEGLRKIYGNKLEALIQGGIENFSPDRPLDALSAVLDNPDLEKLLGRDPSEILDSNEGVSELIGLVEKAGKGEASESSLRKAKQVVESQRGGRPIVNKGVQVGRNDPCPCGSESKFKNCHMNDPEGLKEIQKRQEREKRDAEKLQRHE